MGWRSVIISQPGYLKLKDQALTVEQQDGSVRIPLEDIAVLLLDNPQITLTAPLLSACADQQIAVITTGADHHPNGLLLPYSPHSRSLKVLRQQLALSQPRRKRLWQTLVQQKILNQAAVLQRFEQPLMARKLEALARQVKSGDSDNQEALAAQLYFPALLGKGFTRQQTSFHNALLNYGYAVIRAALAKHLVSYGFLTPLGLHHCNEQNAFNLADDLIEPFRPLVDAYCLTHLLAEDQQDMTTAHKVKLVGLLHQDISTVDIQGELTQRTVLAACEALVISLVQRLADQDNRLHLPLLQA
ncbi:type II CRISPR-associated endonuclease Cas1 [Marinospirillum sp. MEB164]|uniref:CRISPR-associated endonuclease Cas1 n=1 Tax=Marinospirillum alkalitolerans TaxID=3123374 RepID=A0ABW8PZU9_9GAMM